MAYRVVSAIKGKFLQWEEGYWFMPYAYGLTLYLFMTGVLINVKLLSSLTSVFSIIHFRTVWILAINTVVIQSESLEITQKNPQGTSIDIQCGVCC